VTCADLQRAKPAKAPGKENALPARQNIGELTHFLGVLGFWGEVLLIMAYFLTVA